MLLGIAFAAVSLAFGWAAAARITKTNQLAYALPIGVAAGAWAVFLTSLLLGFNFESVTAATILLSAATLLVNNGKANLKHDKHTIILLAIGLLAFTAIQFARFHYDAAGNIAGISIDFGFHSGIITTMANGNFPPVNPFYDGHSFNYYYLTHAFSAALIVGGLSLQIAFMLPIVLASAAFLAIVFLLCRELFPKPEHEVVGYLAIILMLFNGTLAFTNTNVFFFPNQLRELGYPVENLLTSFFTINYSFVLGAAMAMLVLILLTKQKKWEATLLTATLPLVNLPFFALAAIALVLHKINWKQIAACAAIALPQLALLMGDGQFIPYLRFGWMSAEQSIPSIILFWAQNLGPYLILSALALYWLKDKKVNRMWLALVPPAIIANIFIFTPYAWDNYKLFLLFIMYTAILAAYALVELWRKTSAHKAGVIFLIFIMTVIGVLSNVALFEHTNSITYTNEELKICKWIDENTPKDAVFLIDNEMHSCLTSIAGRRVYLGFGEWLTNHGIDYSKQLEENEEMLAGNCSLINSKEITFAYFTPNVKAKEGLEDQSLETYAQNAQVVLKLCTEK